ARDDQALSPSVARPGRAAAGQRAVATAPRSGREWGCRPCCRAEPGGSSGHLLTGRFRSPWRGLVPADHEEVPDVAAAVGVAAGEGPAPRRFGALGLALSVTAVLVAVSVVAALAWRARIQDDERSTFLSTSAQVERRLTGDLERIDATVVAVAAQVADSPPITAQRFTDEIVGAVPVEVPASVVTLAVVEPVDADEVSD
ncbi:hypothetical protein B7486_73685, partial [cyanobacterium TDX16]